MKNKKKKKIAGLSTKQTSKFMHEFDENQKRQSNVGFIFFLCWVPVGILISLFHPPAGIFLVCAGLGCALISKFYVITSEDMMRREP